MKKNVINRKKLLVLTVLIGMILFSIAFLYYQKFHDLEYREEKCIQEASTKMKEFYKETSSDPEEEVYEMFYTDCLRDSGWLR